MLNTFFQFTPQFAAVGNATSEVRALVAYELRRLGQFDDPRQMWGAVAVVAAIAVFYVVWIYRRERHAVPGVWQWLLPGLRALAMAGVLLFFLGLEKRVDQQVITESQVPVLVDTSLSMSVEDEMPAGGEKISRGEAIRQVLSQSPLINDLKRRNKVSLMAFDTKLRRLARWQRQIEAETNAEQEEEDAPLDWDAELQPQGAETRLGNALQKALEHQVEGPLAGVVVISDGGQNSGVEPLGIAQLAQELLVPIYTVGVGSTQPRRNLRVQELSAPSRVYPGDMTLVRGLIRGEGFAGRSIDVELYAQEADGEPAGVDRIGREQLVFSSDDEILPVEFEIEPSEIGRLLLELRIVVPSDDQFPGDNSRQVEVEVVESQTRVLLIAGGPTRDYRFLRNQLRRDRHATVDVWLQSALPGISQDADRILDIFPTMKDELYNYDCIVAFDPDWSMLDAQQVDLLESWVAEEAGGLIVVAGPIYTANWVQSPEHAKIRSLYPVEFQRRLTLLDDGLYGSQFPWPILFSREGEESEFLWLADSQEESRLNWSQFAGVFGCYAVKGPKPGARVLGRYSDPDAGLSVERPVFMAEHFYGGGRVFYIGSGELWRMRSVEVGYFELLTTQLIRHVSQGRLLRGSSRGHLLVQRDRYVVGEEVVVRAKLSTVSREPLVIEQVAARVVDPQGQGENLILHADVARPGNFIGAFNVFKEGAYRITLSVPDAPDELLTHRVQVSIPDLEMETTRRNESLLTALAMRSEGLYYTSLQTAVEGSPQMQALAEQIQSRAEIKIIRGTPDEEFTERINKLLLGIICGALCCEWLARRLLRLA